MNHLADCHLDHVAVAVSDIEKSIKIYTALGLQFSSEREIVESQKVKTAFAPIDANAHIELLEPVGNDGPIAKYIEKKGQGIHHLCFRVQDVKLKQEQLESQGFKFTYPEPIVGAGKCLVNFIHPKSSDGVLIELSQKQED